MKTSSIITLIGLDQRLQKLELHWMQFHCLQWLGLEPGRKRDTVLTPHFWSGKKEHRSCTGWRKCLLIVKSWSFSLPAEDVIATFPSSVQTSLWLSFFFSLRERIESLSFPALKLLLPFKTYKASMKFYSWQSSKWS